jgi:uncharacterized membrane protein
MNIQLLDSGARWALLGLVVGCALIAAALYLLARERRVGWAVAATTVIAILGAGLLVAEKLVVLAVDAAAPASSDFNEFRWVLLAPWGRLGLLLGALTALAVIALGWRASRRLSSPWRRAALMSLRIAAVCTALILFLEPAVELRQVAREPNRVVLLVDTSGSMDLRETPQGPRRIERARAMIAASGKTLDRWEEKHHIDVFEFAETILPSSRATVATGKPRGQATMMRLALEQVRARYDGRELAGVVLVSDGVATGGFSVEGEGATRDFLHSLDTRVHTVWAGRSGLKDVAISQILADEFAFVRTVVRVEAVVRSTGYGKRRIPVTLSSEGKDLRQKWVDIEPGGSAKVVFELSPPRVGKYVYEISTPVADDEAVAENNRRSFVLRVIRDKIRVLQVAGQPSWDVRALRSMLKQNPNVDLISFFILRTVEDHSLVPNNEMSLIPFPTRELFQQELPSFDVIVLQNFEFEPYGIGVYLENIRSYVAGGGGLVMLGGSLSFASGGYEGTPVGTALPVELPRLRSPRDLLDTGTFRPELTAQGKLHPITALRYESNDNIAAWKDLPELEGVNLVGGAKKDAAVLAVHPRLQTRGGEPMPVVVAGEYGDGRTLAITTDSLWRWGFGAAAKPGDDGRHYDKLWENIIRWLIHDPDLRYLHVHSDAVEYPPGAAVRLAVRLLDRDYTPLSGGDVDIEVRRGADPDQAETVAHEVIQVGDSGDGAYELPGLQSGVYRVHARAKVGGKEVVARDIFLVSEGSAELDEPAADSSLLRDIAAATHGEYLGTAAELPAELPFEEPRVVRVDRRTDVELWSRPALLFLAFLFLGLEWVLRQRSGYL